MTTNEEIHQRTRYASGITCGITGAVRVTERLNDATCPRCRYDGDPSPRTRALSVEAAHAKAMARLQGLAS